MTNRRSPSMPAQQMREAGSVQWEQFVACTAENDRLRARDKAAKALIEVFRRHGNYTERLYQCGHPLLAEALEALVRAHDAGGQDR